MILRILHYLHKSTNVIMPTITTGTQQINESSSFLGGVASSSQKRLRKKYSKKKV